MKIGNIVISRKFIMTVTIITLIVSSVVGYSYVNSDLEYSATITIKKPNTDVKLYDKIASNSVSDSIRSDYVNSDTGIDFTQISSETNGRGLYLLSSTASDEYPIYYYRGNVSNNNAKFAGFCWKIVRTTETGGTKLIYNGTPNASGECTNTTGTATQLSSKSAFNTNPNSPAYNGYMYGTVYERQKGTASTSDVYGNTFTYENGTYTLSDIHDGVDATHHYTCFDTTGTCSSLSYVYYVSDSNAYYITLTGGKSVEDALAEMQTNTTSSTVKTAVDNWFNNTFKTYFTTNEADYNDYLEDTVWCNDRSMNTIEAAVSSGTSAVNNGWKPNGGSTSNNLWYSSYGRVKAGTPNLACSNKNDSFTVTESAIGNGALTYPVGLLTADEIMLAGATSVGNSDYYLYTYQYWWSMSPNFFNFESAYEFNAYSTGNLNIYGVHGDTAVRPSVSLKSDVVIDKNGDGTSTNPYVIIE